MLNHHFAWLQPGNTLKILVGCCLILTFFLQLPAARISARMADKPVSGLTLKLDVGFNSFYRMGFWTPVRVSLKNTAADFSGTLAIKTFTGHFGIGAGTP